jgi:glucose/arabinose dehydrogenase
MHAPTHGMTPLTRLGARLLVVAVATALVVTIGASASSAGGGGVRAARVASGLQGPAAFSFTPKGTIIYLERASGEVRFRNPATDFDRLFFRIRGVNGEGERGALGVALHPRWPKKPFVYVYVTRRVDGKLRNQILRIRERRGDGIGFTTIM